MGLPERYESVVDKAIREAMERGEFDDLPGKGKPLPALADADDDEWWVRAYIRREGLTTEDLLPESLLLRRQLERLDDTVADLRTEQAVREHVAELNRQVRRARVVVDGPPVVLRQAPADDVVARWRAGRPGPAVAEPVRAPTPAARRSWWRRTRGSDTRR